MVGVGVMGQWLREWFVVVEGDEWQEGRMGSDYVRGDHDVGEAVSVRGLESGM